MCGIIYAESFTGRPVNEIVKAQYELQKHRGQEGFGLFNGQFTVKAAMEKRINRWLGKKKNSSSLILFHHRMPTSTINVKQAAHPFNTGHYFGDTQYILVHNGWISNADELFTKHQEVGIDYHSLLPDLTFNDSEALLWDFALTMEGKQEKLQAYGNIAFVCIKKVNGVVDKLYFGRNSTKPLNMLRTKQGMMLSSEGEGEEIDSGKLYTYNYKLKRLTKHFFSIPQSDPKYKWPVQSTYPYASSYKRSFESRRWNYGAEEYVDENGHLAYTEEDDDRYSQWWQQQLDEDNEVRQIDEVLQKRDFELKKTRYYNSLTDWGVSKNSDEFDILCQYMSDAEGNYDDAYWAMEAEYEEMEEYWQDNEYAMSLLLNVVDLLSKDPNYEENQTYNPIWGQQLLLEA